MFYCQYFYDFCCHSLSRLAIGSDTNKNEISILEYNLYPMGKKLENLTFEQWLIHVFDHPVDTLSNAWYWDIDRDWWEEDTTDTLAFMTHAFEHAADVFQPYSDTQLNQGLWFLASNACSSH